MAEPITPAQVRGARGMLNWSMMDLANAAGISVSTVKRLELAQPQPVSGAVFATVQAAFERAGVRFLADVGEGVGLCFQPR